MMSFYSRQRLYWGSPVSALNPPPVISCWRARHSCKRRADRDTRCVAFRILAPKVRCRVGHPNRSTHSKTDSGKRLKWRVFCARIFWEQAKKGT
eukprot:1390184-Rhodomonas_salina.1